MNDRYERQSVIKAILIFLFAIFVVFPILIVYDILNWIKRKVKRK